MRTQLQSRFAEVFIPQDAPGEPELPHNHSPDLPVVTAHDFRRLKQLIRTERQVPRHGVYLNALERKLRRSLVVYPEDVQPDVVTMNSRVRMEDLISGEEVSALLVYPHLGADREGYACVLTPLGTALLGSRVGYEVRDGVGRPLRIDGILYQPEAARDFYL